MVCGARFKCAQYTNYKAFAAAQSGISGSDNDQNTHIASHDMNLCVPFPEDTQSTLLLLRRRIMVPRLRSEYQDGIKHVSYAISIFDLK